MKARTNHPGTVLLLAAAALALPAGCRRDTPPVRGIEQVLLAPSKRSTAARHRPDSCSLGDDLRPARGCLAVAYLRASGTWSEVDDVPGRAFVVPRRLRGRDLVLDRMHRGKKRGWWTHLPPVLLRDAPHEAWVPFPDARVGADGSHKVRVGVALLGGESERLVAQAVPIGREMVLEGAIGIHPLMEFDGAGTVEFVIRAEVVGGEAGATPVELFRRRLNPTDGSRAWTDYRIGLEDLAGQTIRLTFSARLASPEAVPLSAPLWTLPALLRPVAPRRNVLLVSLDTLRADSVGTYGSRLPTTPEIDAFGRQGVVFEDALTTFPSTTASHMSMLTGTYPSVHRVLAPATPPLSRRIPTLAEALAADGYNTAAFTENGMIIPGSGFARGFRSYREFKTAGAPGGAVTKGHVAAVVTAALDWLDRVKGDTFFLFAHTYQVHGPYDPPAEFDVFDETWEGTATRAPSLVRARNKYAGEVRYTDREIGRLLRGLEERGLADDTIVIITADHGEAFGEHGSFSHGKTAYAELIEIPLLLRAPGLVAPGQRVSEPVSLVDVVPTVLDLLGRPVPEVAQGRSLRPLAEGTNGGFAPRAVYAEVLGRHDVVAPHTASRKWILSPSGEAEPEVYDRRNDPTDDHPLDGAAELREGRRWADEFQAEARRLRAAVEEGTPTAPVPELDDKTQQKLKLLGYVE